MSTPLAGIEHKLHLNIRLYAAEKAALLPFCCSLSVTLLEVCISSKSGALTELAGLETAAPEPSLQMSPL